MARGVYDVVEAATGWVIRNSGNEYTGYRTREAALKAAVAAAQRLGETGHDTEVRLLGADGTWTTEWTYGEGSAVPLG
jgi:hypothetical protein